MGMWAGAAAGEILVLQTPPAPAADRDRRVQRRPVVRNRRLSASRKRDLAADESGVKVRGERRGRKQKLGLSVPGPNGLFS